MQLIFFSVKLILNNVPKVWFIFDPAADTGWLAGATLFITLRGLWKLFLSIAFLTERYLYAPSCW